MTTLRFAPLFLLLAFAACHSRPNIDKFIGPGQLPTTLFIIDVSRDTTLTTPKGAILRIPRGAMDVSGSTEVQLQVKEAYSIDDMIRGRLTTTSNGHLLSSGGMIFIDVAGGINATLRKPIRVSIPVTHRRQHGMMVFKGAFDGRGEMDWMDPQPMDSSGDPRLVEAGHALFNNNCASCHALGKTLIGPPLAFITERRSPKWLAGFTRNCNGMIKGDAYSCWLFERYSKTPMNTFPNLTDVDLKNLYGYIEDASSKYDPAKVVDEKKAFDSCLAYVRKKLLLYYRTESLMGVSTGHPSLSVDSIVDAEMARIITRKMPESWQVADTDRIPNFFAPQPKYYEFSIRTLGWHNCDILVAGLPGMIESDFSVQLTGKYRGRATIWLAIPSLRLFTPCSPNEKDEFLAISEGKTPLPQGATAYVLAIGEDRGNLVFGQKEWITGPTQRISISPSPVSREEFDRAIARLDRQAPEEARPLPDSIARINTVQQKAIQKQYDSAMAQLSRQKPANCDCGCECLPIGAESVSAYVRMK